MPSMSTPMRRPTAQCPSAVLPTQLPSLGSRLSLVVGGGLTGIEAAAEMPATAAPAGTASAASSWLIMRRASAPTWARAPNRHRRSLGALAWKCAGASGRGRRRRRVRSCHGRADPAATVVWCAGMHAHPLTASSRSNAILGRLPVEPSLELRSRRRVRGRRCAWLLVDDVHCSVMSCQHGRPMGRFRRPQCRLRPAGPPLLPLASTWYLPSSTSVRGGPSTPRAGTESWCRRGGPANQGDHQPRADLSAAVG